MCPSQPEHKAIRVKRGLLQSMVSSDSLLKATCGHPFWGQRLRMALRGAGRIHLAVFVEPYLKYILEGRKTVESRFSRDRRAPWEQVGAGDVLLLKRSSGPVLGIAEVSDAWFYELSPRSLSEIHQRFGPALCLEPSFLEGKSAASFASLIQLREVRGIGDLPVHKTDRRGWVVLRKPD